MRRSIELLAFAAAVAAPCLATPATADEVFKPTAAVTIPANTFSPVMRSWDISFVDPTLGQFFLGDRSHNAVDVVNTGDNTFRGFIGQGKFTGTKSCPSGSGAGPNDCRGPNGVLTTNHTELWASDGDSTVKVFDLSGDLTTPTHVISTGGKFRGDEMCFDPEQQFVMVANNSQVDSFTDKTGTHTGPFATIISVKTHTVVAHVPFDGSAGGPTATNGAEQCSYSARTERFYITLPGVNTPDDGTGAVVRINPEDLDDAKLIDKFAIYKNTDCDTPQGTAKGPADQILVGCNGSTASQNAIIIDDRNLNIIAKIANESGPDEVWYNPGDGQYFLARSAAPGGQQLLGVIDARGPAADPSVFVANEGTGLPTSHSVAADPVKNQVYVAIGAGASTVCGANGGSDSVGCIAVYTASGKDDACLAEGAPVKSANAGEDAVFLNGRCVDNDRHHEDRDE